MAESVAGRREDQARVRFAVLQWIDAASPSNFLALNPEAQKKAIETQGESLAARHAPPLGRPAAGHLSQTDESAFEVGRNVATTEGCGGVRERVLPAPRVQAAHAPRCYERPLLFVPPCINKFYILDLQPENSLIRHAVGEGPPRLRRQLEERRRGDRPAHLGRLHRGRGDPGDRPGRRRSSGSEQINTLGFCIGGTILATALAVLAARGERPAASMTLLTTLPRLQRHRRARHLHRRGVGADARDDDRRRERRRRQPAQGPGAGHDLQLPAPERPGLELRRRQLPEGRDAAAVRPAVLEQRRHQPARADVLLVPAQHLPREQAQGAGRADGLRREDRPRQDRARRPTSTPRARTTSCPGTGAYRSTAGAEGQAPLRARRLGPHRRRDQPAAKKKRSHWIGKTAALPASPDAWLAQAERAPGQLVDRLGATGSRPFGGKQVAAPKAPGNRKYKAIEPAPGRYVKEKA